MQVRFERAASPHATDLDEVRVDHGGGHIGVPELFLYSADVVAGLK